ncbi:MAG: DUF4412 domain-containing protein [Flavobacteriales bacterium]|nr:DUF4412 domain-containing protein [Flavobacteriales bacterium]
MKIAHVFIALLAANWAVAQSFEGVITMNTTNEAMKENASVTWYIKGERSRMEVASKAGEHNTQYVLVADAKGTDLIADDHITPVPPTALKTEMANLQLVSKREGVMVNGFTCVQEVYTDGVNQVTYWLSTESGLSFNDLPAVFRKNMPRIESAGFPVKMEKRDAAGKVVVSQDVLSVAAAKVDDSKFERR